jgi:hypothetical protein
MPAPTADQRAITLDQRAAFKRLAAFGARLAALYGLLMILWLAVAPAYAPAFRFASQLLFGSIGPVTVRFEPLSQPEGRHLDTRMVFRHTQMGSGGSLAISSRFIGYAPTVIAAALVLATPLPRGRRVRALLWALGMIQAYVGLRLWLLILSLLCGQHEGAIFKMGPTADNVLGFAAELISNSLAGTYLGPIIIWASTFRRGDLNLLVRSSITSCNARSPARSPR